MFAEPVIFASAAYLLWTFGVVMLTSVLMRKARARWPRVGTLGLALGVFAVLLMIEVAIESGLDTLPVLHVRRRAGHLTLLSGSRFQIRWWEVHYLMAVVPMGALRFG